MTTLTHAAQDSATMLRRNLRHALRYPSMTFGTLAMPVLMLLLFVYVFGGSMDSGLGGGDYIDYLVPGILLMTAGAGAVPTAVAVCTDMTEGIVDRFRTMAIARGSILTGHVIGSAIQTLLSIVLVVGVALLMGFGPTASALDWLAAFGLLALLTLALTWLATALGLATKTPEAASNAVLPFTFLLPFVSSAFVDPDTMPAGIRWFAESQPFTVIIDTLRALLTDAPTDGDPLLAMAWCVVLATAGYAWARRLYDR